MKLEFRGLEDAGDWDWVCSQVPIVACQDTSGIIAVSEGERVAACILDNWSHSSVQFHIMITSPFVLRAGFMEVCADHVFNKCKRETIHGYIPADNVKSVRLARHTGFKVAVRLKDAWKKGVDYLIVEMRKEDCTFLPEAT